MSRFYSAGSTAGEESPRGDLERIEERLDDICGEMARLSAGVRAMRALCEEIGAGQRKLLAQMGLSAPEGKR